MPRPVKFLKSAVLVADYPHGNRPEIAVSGRSNSGKSSFINALTGSKIAKVSQDPGKTRLLNFFDVGDFYRLVDTPGYGFAARSGDEIREWQKMIEDYLSTRGNLVGLLLLMDVRREWSEDEALLLDFMNSIGKETMLLLTKTDRCTHKELNTRILTLQKSAGVAKVWPISSQENTGIKEVDDYLFKVLVKPAVGRFSGGPS